MKFGFVLPNRGPLAAPEAMIQLAHAGEELGFAYAAVGDHVMVPRAVASRYPYSETGDFGQSGECYDQLALLAFVAAQTRRVRLLTSVMVVPHRQPVTAAKTIATIDALSGGRMTLGVGAGWMAEEFAALQLPPFDERGSVTDEYIAIFRALWTQEEPHFEGRYARFKDVIFRPKPPQGSIPIWVGGESGPALSRAARIGDAWYPIGINPKAPLDTLPRYRAGLDALGEELKAAGRNPKSLHLAYYAVWYNETAQPAFDGQRRLFTGAPAQVAGDIAAFRALGVGTIVFSFIGNPEKTSLAPSLARMERFVREVLPLAS
ncbi:MAG: LLM class F420-dependent oxidoreductase [Alphaproteobacteria bacterium]|nr:LLM class F420-dependent oxidoreductase [Alphaproteobacteria bacterium]